MGFFDQKRRYDDADFENGFIEPEIADADEAVYIRRLRLSISVSFVSFIN